MEAKVEEEATKVEAKSKMTINHLLMAEKKDEKAEA